MQQEDINSLVSAVNAAEAYVNGLKPGVVFRGVLPEANERFPEDKLARAIFMSHALDRLPGIICDQNAYVILEIKPR